jgi:hypothetical protein
MSVRPLPDAGVVYTLFNENSLGILGSNSTLVIFALLPRAYILFIDSLNFVVVILDYIEKYFFEFVTSSIFISSINSFVPNYPVFE